MAQLYFRYGTMNAGKSLQLLAVKHNYEEKGEKVWVVTSALDDRNGVGKVTSRVGLETEATAISRDDPLEIEWGYYLTKNKGELPACVLVDEAEFLTTEQVSDLAAIVDEYGVPVICYGLKVDFMGRLFEGSKALLELADKIEEIKTVCQFCDNKATMNLRLADGKPVREGEQVVIGDSEYISVCRNHYYSPVIKEDK